MQGLASSRRSVPLTTALALVLILLAPAPVASALRRCGGLSRLGLGGTGG